MTRFALGAKCGRPERPPVSVASPAAIRSSPSSDHRAARPIPPVPTFMNERRFISLACSIRGSINSRSSKTPLLLLFRHNRIEVENQTRQQGVRGQLAHVEFFVARGLALAQDFQG